MADTWRYLDELVAGFADNTQGLIKAEDTRELTFSGSILLGAVHTGNGTVTAGTDVNMNPNLGLTYLGGQGYDMDGNGQLIVSLTGAATIPANYARILEMNAQFTFESSTNELTTFAFQVDGQVLEHTRIGIEWTTQSQPVPVSIHGMWGTGIDTPHPVTVVQTKATGTATIANFSMSAKNYVASTAAAPDVWFNGTNRGYPT